MDKAGLEWRFLGLGFGLLFHLLLLSKLLQTFLAFVGTPFLDSPWLLILLFIVIGFASTEVDILDSTASVCKHVPLVPSHLGQVQCSSLAIGSFLSLVFEKFLPEKGEI